MRTPNNEITIFYHSSSRKGKQSYAYAKTVARHVKAYDFSKQPFTPAILQDLLNMLGTDAKSILDKSRSDYRQNFKGKEYDEEGWLHILINHPELIRAPIAVYRNKARLLDNPSDVYALTKAAKLALEEE